LALLSYFHLKIIIFTANSNEYSGIDGTYIDTFLLQSEVL